MVAREVPDEKLLQEVEVYRRFNSAKDAAEHLGMSARTFRGHMAMAKYRGMLLSDGAKRVVDTAKLSPAEAKGGWLHSYDSDGKKIGATRWQAQDISPEDWLDRLESAFAGIAPAPIIPSPDRTLADLVTIYPIADAHIGMMAWGKETGEDYDTAKACSRLTRWIGRAVASSPASETAIVIGVGDLTHADDQTNQTPRSKHALDVDTRHFKTMDMTIAAIGSAIETAAQKHEKVIVPILPGNHDMHSYMAILFAMHERYRDNPRIEIVKRPGEFFVRRFGKLLIAAHHGDKAKPERIVLMLSDSHAEDWGQTKKRVLFTGHLHHLKSADIGGVEWEQLRAMTAKDGYAVSHAYAARAELQAITYNVRGYEDCRFKVGVMNGDD
jgi:hypothetical protein